MGRTVDGDQRDVGQRAHDRIRRRNGRAASAASTEEVSE
jgi:hypothetical protein